MSSRTVWQIYLHHSPSLPQPSAGQSESISCQNPAPVVESRTQARLCQHWPQQHCASRCRYMLYLQSSASRFVQGLPGKARLHSDKGDTQLDERRGRMAKKIYQGLDQTRSGCDLDAVWMWSGCGLDAVWMRSGCSLDAVWTIGVCGSLFQITIKWF